LGIPSKTYHFLNTSLYKLYRFQPRCLKHDKKRYLEKDKKDTLERINRIRENDKKDTLKKDKKDTLKRITRIP